MKAPLFLTLAVLAPAFPLAAQSAPSFLSGDPDGDFHDLGISGLVDAIDALRDPAPPALPARREAPDASLCLPDSLLFADPVPLALEEAPCPPGVRPATDDSRPLTREVSPAGPAPARPASVPAADPEESAAAPAAQPVLAGAAPLPADQVPEPSAVLLVLGAAAWILLRRKY